MDTSNYQQLTRTFQRLYRFSHLSSIAGWDMMTMMPSAGSAARGEALAELSVLKHQILTDKKVAQWLEAAAQEDLNDVEQANLREMTRHYQQAAVLPESLVEAKSLAGSRCEHAWRSQRPANDWEGFSANLKEVVKLSREEAKLRAAVKGCTPYDALLDLYEPDMTAAKLDVLFADLKSWLPDLLNQAVAKQAQRQLIAPVGPFPVEKQRELGLTAMHTLGFNFDAGRLDISAHPFCGGVPEDVRITTRYDEICWVPSLAWCMKPATPATSRTCPAPGWDSRLPRLARWPCTNRRVCSLRCSLAAARRSYSVSCQRSSTVLARSPPLAKRISSPGTSRCSLASSAWMLTK